MPMPPYAVACPCGRPAGYKVAARWSDGATHEYKTYALCCATCLPAAFKLARAKQAACRLGAGEKLDKPAVFARGAGGLERCSELERQLTAGE